MKKAKDAGRFTHFGSIPFIRPEHRQSLQTLQQKITQTFKQKSLHPHLKPNNPDLFHLTLSMLTLPHSSQREKTQQLLAQHREEFYQLMRDTVLTTDQVRYFTYKKNLGWGKKSYQTVSVIYLDLMRDQKLERVVKLVDVYVRLLLKEELIVNQELKQMYIELDLNKNMFRNKDPHITLFRCQNLQQSPDFLQCFSKIKDLHKGHPLECDYIDISTRFDFDETRFYTPLYRIYLDKQMEEKEKEKETGKDKK